MEDTFIHIELKEKGKEWHKTFHERDLDIMTKQFDWNVKILFNYVRNRGNDDGKFRLFLLDATKGRKGLKFQRGGNRLDYSFVIDVPEGKNDLFLYEAICSSAKYEKQYKKLTNEVSELTNAMTELETKNRVLKKQKTKLVIEVNQCKKQIDMLTTPPNISPTEESHSSQTQ